MQTQSATMLRIGLRPGGFGYIGRTIRASWPIVSTINCSPTKTRKPQKSIGLWLAEISVDNFLPPVEYFLTPMKTAWAVTIVRRAAEECKEREIHRSKLYEALDFLEKNMDASALVKTYRRALQGDRPEEWQKDQLRQVLRAAVVGIQRAAAASLVKE